MGCETMTQRMNGYLFMNSGFRHAGIKRAGNRPAGDMPYIFRARKKPAFRAVWTIMPPIRPQGKQRSFRQDCITVPFVLSGFYKNPHFFGINIRNPQRSDITDPQPRTIGYTARREDLQSIPVPLPAMTANFTSVEYNRSHAVCFGFSEAHNSFCVSSRDKMSGSSLGIFISGI